MASSSFATGSPPPLESYRARRVPGKICTIHAGAVRVEVVCRRRLARTVV